MKRLHTRFLWILIITLGACLIDSTPGRGAARRSYDLVVYGGTSGGVIAAVKAARMGGRVLLIEPGHHLGGLTSGGLGATDIGNKDAIGGMAREFYARLYQHYTQDSSWTFQKQEEYHRADAWHEDRVWWMFEPHAAKAIFRQMLREAGVSVAYRQRLDLKRGVRKRGARIVSITMESGQSYRAKMFIDATYEGDLMAKAGVSYTVGRESNATYGETLNGVQTKNAIHHQFLFPVDPYSIPGDPSSGLLPGVHSGGPGTEGEGDHRVQAYNFRICMTDAPENRTAFPKPKGYDPLRYELLLRYYEAGYEDIPWHPLPMPNRKTDTNNNHGFSTDHIGMNDDYPDGNYRTRAKIIRDHERYQKGLLWTLAHHPRVPEKVREEVSRWGLAKDEFKDNRSWPHQLYVREARRMIGEYVMSELNCRGKRVAPDSIGLAAYTMDSHNTQRYVDAERHARNEGDVQIGGFPPYPISYRSVIPKESECSNLLVPVCLSASHIAFGSIRMEPVFMVLGQSSATAACLALDEGISVQQLDYETLRGRLSADRQVLKWN